MPTEIAISDRREAELAKNGFIPLSTAKTLITPPLLARSLYKTAGVLRSGRYGQRQSLSSFAYLFACSRFAHFLKCIVRDKMARSKSVKICSAGSMSGL